MLPPPQRTSSADSAADGIRKRVCKACDRCRLKKSKCDGASPCSRCKADNAICVFGERKKSHDKVYPKGYVEMLEQQQSQLVQGLQEMYRRSLKGKAWHTAPLAESNGNPLTHDLLAALDLLESKNDGSNDKEEFEEDLSKLQQRLYDRGAPVMRRRASLSSESEHSLHGLGRPTPQGTPLMSQPPIFKEDFSFSASPSPISQSPMPRQRQSYPPVQHTFPTQQSPLHQASPLARDPQLYQHEWPMNNFNDPVAMMRSGFAMKTPRLQHTLDDVEGLMMNNGQWEPPGLYDQDFNAEPTSFPQSSAPYVTSYGGSLGLPHDDMQSFQDFITVDG